MFFPKNGKKYPTDRWEVIKQYKHAVYQAVAGHEFNDIINNIIEPIGNAGLILNVTWIMLHRMATWL